MYSQTSSMQKYIVQCYITLQYDDRRRYYLLHTHISQYSSTYLSPILVLPIRSFLRRSQSEVRLCRIIVQFCIKCMVSREESYVSLVRYNNAPFYKTMSRLLQFLQDIRNRVIVFIKKLMATNNICNRCPRNLQNIINIFKCNSNPNINSDDI